MMSTKINPFTTETLQVRWAHLHAPDNKFGEDASNHNITVVVDAQLQTQLDTLQKENGAKKINGLREDEDGITLLKAKSKVFVKKGTAAFPCRDAKAEMTEATPFGGDTVRLRLAPMVLSRDNSMSVFLNGVQIIEKKPYEGDAGSGGFEATDGFDGTTYEAPKSTTPDVDEEDMGDIPF